MLDQLRVVLNSYIRRRTNWALAALAIGLPAVFCLTSDGLEAFGPVTPTCRFWSASNLHNNWRQQHQDLGLVQHDQTAWDWSDFDDDADAVYVDHGPAIPWDRLKQMPNLRQLRLSRFTRTTPQRQSVAVDLRRLSEFPTLEFLSLPKCGFTKNDVQSWATLKHLEWMDATRAEFQAGIQSLPVFPNLRTLELRLDTLTAKSLRYLKDLPNLTTLVLRHGAPSGQRHRRSSFFSAPPEQHQMLQRMAELSSLRNVYLPGREFSDLEQTAIQSLPGVRVRPLLVNRCLNTFALLGMVGSAVIALITGLALTGQFTRPESRLTPNYALPHQLVAAFLLIVAIAAATWCLSRVGVHAWTAMGLTSLSVAMMLGLCHPCGSHLRYVLIGAIPLVLIVTISSIGQIYLRKLWLGESIWFGPLLLVGSVAYIVCWLRGGQQFHCALAEKGLPTPLLDFNDSVMAGQVSVARRSEGRLAPMASHIGPNDQQVAKLAADFHGHQTNRRRGLFELPSVGSNKSIVLKLIDSAPVWVYIAFHCAATYNYRQEAYRAGEYTIHLGLVYYLLFLVSVMRFSRWAQRQPTFGYELCRPVRRVDFVDDLFATMRCSALKVQFPIFLVVPALMLLRHTLVMTIVWSFTMAVAAWGAALFLHGTSMWILMTTRLWRIAVVFIVQGAVLIACIIAVHQMSGRSAIMSPLAVVCIGSVLGAAGVIVVRLARTRWMNMELALLVPS